MATTELRKVKSVNGWKVNHPHSAANIFYAIFTLIFAAFPLSFLYLSLIQGDPSLTGSGLFRFFIEFIQGLFKGDFAPTPSDPVIIQVIQGIKPDLQQAGYYMFVGLSALLVFTLVFSVIKVILSIVHLGKGYLKRPGAVVGIAITEFVFSIIYLAIFLFFYFAYKAQSDAYLNIWYSFIPAGISLFFMIFFAAMNSVHFKDTILEKDLEIHDGEPVVEHLTKVHEVKKVTYRQSSTLPKNLTSISGHAFSENQNLTVANIPLAVKKIGPGAFANCLNLQVVSIPAGVNEIGFNAFFNCASLQRINYGGTKAEWSKIQRGSNWLAKAKTTEVVCADGAIVVNPYN